VHPGVLKIGRIGLAHQDEIPDDWKGWFEPWWIVFPVPRRDLDGAPVVAVKGVAFDPSSQDWKRDDDGRKIPRNVGSALWDLVPTAGGEPCIEDSPLVLCEGEIDALCAVSNGFNAVTGTAGAGTFKPEWASYAASMIPAKQHGIVVAYDGDETGREGAKTTAQRLHEAGADVRIASLPDGQDVNDVLLNGSETDLHAYLAQADPFQPEPEDEHQDEASGPDVQPLLGTEEPGPMDWRVNDFVPEDHLTMLIGDGGTGKSILALHLSLRICTGRPFLGMGTRQGRVLYIDHELEREEQLRRVHKIARGMGMDASDPSLRDQFLYWRPKYPLGSREHQERLLKTVDEHSIDLVVLDSLTMGAQGDVTDVADVVPIMQDVRQWPTTVAIDHVSHSTAKGSASQARAFGSVFKRNAARSSLTLAQADTGGYCIQQEKSNFSDGDGRLVYAVEWGEDEITFDSISDADERAAGLLSDLSSKGVTKVAVEEMWDASQQPVMPSDVVTWRQEHVEGNKVQTEKAVRNHFSALKRKEKIVTDKHGGAMPAKAKHEPPPDTSDEDGEVPF
jgi:archaellum biogenesis ATPase FlaH